MEFLQLILTSRMLRWPQVSTVIPHMLQAYPYIRFQFYAP